MITSDEKSSFPISIIAYLAITIFLLLFVASIFLAPLFIQSSNRLAFGFATVFYNFNAWLCHQLPERSLQLFGAHLPLDARMTGIFIGALLGLFSPFFLRYPRPIWPWIVAFLLLWPIAIDGVSQTILLMRESNNVLRMVTGILAGFGLFSVLAFELLRKVKPNIKGVFGQGKALKIATLANILIIVFVFVLSIPIGRSFVSSREAVAIAKSRVQEDRLAVTKTFYLAPNAVISLHTDPYLDRYNDAVLKDAQEMANAYHFHSLLKLVLRPFVSPHGLWVVALLEREPQINNKDIHFLPPTPGRYFYIDSVSGRILKDIRH
jgi:uncharacterized membrane protein